jgi:hypothetical protein
MNIEYLGRPGEQAPGIVKVAWQVGNSPGKLFADQERFLNVMGGLIHDAEKSLARVWVGRQATE